MTFNPNVGIQQSLVGTPAIVLPEGSTAPPPLSEADLANIDAFVAGGGIVRLPIIEQHPPTTTTQPPAAEPPQGEPAVPDELLGALIGGATNLANSPLGQAIILNQLGIGGAPAAIGAPVLVGGGIGAAIPQRLPIQATSALFGPDVQLPGFDIPGVDFGLSGAPCIRPNPQTGRFPSELTFVDGSGKIRSYTNRGRPVLWSRDRSTAARTNRLLGGRVTKSGVTRSRRRSKPQVTVCAVCNGSSHDE